MKVENYKRKHITKEYTKLVDEAYQVLINPIMLVHHLKTKEKFIEWCELGTVEDLEATILEFEKEELYEHIIIIRNVIKRKNE